MHNFPDTPVLIDLIRRVAQIVIPFVSEFEGLHKQIGGGLVQSYWDPNGRVWTIGRGLTGPDIGKQTIWTLEQEAERFKRRVEFTVERVIGMVHIGLTDNQYAALTSFAFNVGLDEDSDDIPEGLGDSTLLKLVNAGRIRMAADEFLKWNKSWDPATKTRVELKGLTRRRTAERLLFLTGGHADD